MEALGCLPSNDMSCSASLEDDCERDICGENFISGICGAARGVIDGLRDFVMVGTSLPPMEFTLGNFLPWVSSMIFKANS